MRVKNLTALWIGVWLWTAAGVASGQQGGNPWARLGEYRGQLEAAAQQGDGNVQAVRERILDQETFLGILLNLPFSDPEGGDLYFKKAIALVEAGGASDDPVEALGARIDVYQQYAGFLSTAGRHGGAEEWLERSLRVIEEHAEAWARLPADDPKREAVPELRGKLPDLLRDAASVASYTGRGQRGLDYLDRADGLAPLGDDREASFPVLKTRARLLEALGRNKEALDLFTRASAVRLDPEMWPSIESLSRELGTSAQASLATARELRRDAAVDFPDFRLRTAADGSEVTFEGVKGKVTLFNVFFPTCGFCNAEMPHLKEIGERYADQGLSLVSVNLLPDQDELIDGWQEKGGYSHPILVTETTEYLVETLGLAFPGGMPANFLVDDAGKVHFRHIGYQKGEEEVIEAQIRELLGLAPFRTPSS